MASDGDKIQLGLTDEAKAQADEVQEMAGFRDRQDVYRLAAAIALAEGLDPTAAELRRTTYVNIGGLDPDGSLRAATKVLREDHDGRPGALIERLAEAGVAKLHEEIAAGRPLREYLARYQVAEASEAAEVSD